MELNENKHLCFSYIEDCVTKEEALELLKNCEQKKSAKEKEVTVSGSWLEIELISLIRFID